MKRKCVLQIISNTMVKIITFHNYLWFKLTLSNKGPLQNEASLGGPMEIQLLFFEINNIKVWTDIGHCLSHGFSWEKKGKNKIRISPIKQKAPIKFAYHYARQHKKGKNESMYVTWNCNVWKFDMKDIYA
jgi:hypothetical protein